MAIQLLGGNAVAPDLSQFTKGMQSGQTYQLGQAQLAQQKQATAFEAQNQDVNNRLRTATILGRALDMVKTAPPEQQQGVLDAYKRTALQLEPESAGTINGITLADVPALHAATTTELQDVQTQLAKFGLQRDQAMLPGELSAQQQGLQEGGLRMTGMGLANDAQGLQNTEQRARAAYYNSLSGGSGAAGGDYYSNVAKVESGGDPNAATGVPGQSASGLYQFTDGTWKGVVNSPEGKAAGLTIAGKNDPNQQKIGVQILTKQNTAALGAAGIPVNQKTAYLAHFLGPAGAAALLKADPNSSAAGVLPQAAAANRSIFYNKDGSARTASQVAQIATAAFPAAPVDGTASFPGAAGAGAAAPVAAPAGAPSVPTLLAAPGAPVAAPAAGGAVPTLLAANPAPSGTPSPLDAVNSALNGGAPAAQAAPAGPASPSGGPVPDDSSTSGNPTMRPDGMLTSGDPYVDRLYGALEQAKRFNDPVRAARLQTMIDETGVNSGLTKEGLAYAIAQYRKTHVMPAIGQQSAAARKAILNGAGAAGNGNSDLNDAQAYKARGKFVQELASSRAGTAGGIVRSLSTSIDHLATLSALASALQTGDIQGINRISNFFSSQTGSPQVTDFDTAKQVVGAEIVKAIAGSAGGVADREGIESRIAAASSPEQLAGQIRTLNNLLAGQLDGLHQQAVAYDAGDQLERQLTPAARAALGLDAGGSGAPPPPKVNDVQDGHRYKGGDPSKPESWEPVS